MKGSAATRGAHAAVRSARCAQAASPYEGAAVLQQAFTAGGGSLPPWARCSSGACGASRGVGIPRIGGAADASACAARGRLAIPVKGTVIDECRAVACSQRLSARDRAFRYPDRAGARERPGGDQGGTSGVSSCGGAARVRNPAAGCVPRCGSPRALDAAPAPGRCCGLPAPPRGAATPGRALRGPRAPHRAGGAHERGPAQSRHLGACHALERARPAGGARARQWPRAAWRGTAWARP
jgi:hypothetical protein